MFVESCGVLLLICVETVVGLLVEDTHVAESSLVSGHSVVLLLLSLFNIEVVDCLVLKNLSLFYVPEVRAQYLEGFIGSHWKLETLGACSCAILSMSEV